MLKGGILKMLKETIFIQKNRNKELANKLASKGIKNLRLTSVGNSIASGYSMLRTTQPLLLRNNSLEESLQKNGISLELHHFSRAQNNNDEHIFEWLYTNIPEIEINKYNHMDCSTASNSMPTNDMSKEKVDRFYPLNQLSNKGFRDIALESNSTLANILIYNGCTGSFLDNITRQGKFSQMFMYGIKRDLTAIEATLKLIQSNNRLNNSNTQVYICGVPNFLGLNISSLINNKLKKLEEKYANVTYVEPIKSKLIYNKYNSEEDYGVDIHYDEVEYLELNNQIIEAIINYYQVNKSLIATDRFLYQYSKEIEMYPTKIDDKIIDSMLFSFLEKVVEENENPIQFLRKTRNYLLEREPYDFYYIGKTNIKNTLSKIKGKKEDKTIEFIDL